MIAKATEADILRLFHAEKWPIGTIARELGLHHTTVQRVLRQSGVEPAAVAPRPSVVDPFMPFIREQLEKYPKLRASRLFVMVKERGYPGRADHFRRIIGRVRPKKPPEAFLRLRTLPGEQAQVDWAHFGKITIGRATRPLWAFVMVLSYSRRLALRFFPGLSMPFFLRGHVDALDEFGGVPRVVLYDNLKSAVLERQGDAVRFNPTLLELAAHYRFEPRPVAVARGNEKGRVERAIRYVREAFFEGRAFVDLSDLNKQAIEWTAGAAQDRPWVEDRARLVRDAFDEDRKALLPPPSDPFPAFERCEVEIGKTPYARFDLNDYSIPHTQTQKTLVVFADLETINIHDGLTVIATHPRSWDRGQQIENPHHLEQLVEEKRNARAHRGIDRLAKSAPSSKEFLVVLARRGDNIGAATAALLRLLDSTPAKDIEDALAEAIAKGTIHVGAVRQILDRGRAARGIPPPISIPVARADLVIKPHALSTYDNIKKKDSDP